MRFFCCFSFWECHVWRFLFINSLQLWPHLTLREYDLNKLNLHYLRMLPRKFQLSDRLVVKNIFKDFLYILLSKKNPPPLCGPTLPLGMIIWTILNIHCLRMLPAMLQLFWRDILWEELFKFVLKILLCKNFNHPLWSYPTPGMMIWTN